MTPLLPFISKLLVKTLFIHGPETCGNNKDNYSVIFFSQNMWEYSVELSRPANTPKYPHHENMPT